MIIFLFFRPKNGKEWQNKNIFLFLQSCKFDKYIETTRGKEWLFSVLNIQEGQNYILAPNINLKYLEDWLLTNDEKKFLSSKNGYQFINGQCLFLNSIIRTKDFWNWAVSENTQWLCSGNLSHVLNTNKNAKYLYEKLQNRDLFFTDIFHSWITENKWFLLETGFLQSNECYKWFESSFGRNWLKTTDGIKWLNLEYGIIGFQPKMDNNGLLKKMD